MLKRILMVIMVSCFLPVMVHAANWSLTTWARNSGGTIQVGNDAARTNLQGQLTTTFDYATTPAATVTVAPNTGYVVSQVILNGVTLTNPTQTTFDVSGPTAQSVQVYFALQKFSITSSVAGNTGGTVSPLSITGLTYNVALTVAKTVTFTPTSAVFTLSSITGIPVGVTPAAYQTPAVPVTGQAVKVTFPVGFKFTSNVVLVGTFTSLNPVANAGSPQSATTGATVTLNGNGSQTSGGVGISSYLWSQTSGPAVTLSNANAAVASFIPTVGGTYSFSLKLMPGGSTAATTVTVYESLPGLVRDKCYNCHSAAGIGVATNVFGNWSSSGHKAKGVVCSQCHVGADTGGHPGVIRSGSVSTTTFNYAGSAGSGNFCVTCHNPAIVTEFAASKHSTRAGSASCSFCHVGGVHNPNAACVDCHNPGSPYGLPWPPTGLEFHNDYSGTNLCANCHNRHNPKVVTGMSGAAHYNNITSAGYPASYVTSKAVCANCHVSNETNTAVRHQWAKSGHAAFTDLPWTEYDFKTRSGCVLCHTTTGFISYSTGRVTAAWGVASDKTKEVLACNGCHSNVENGVVRTVSPIKPFAADTYVNRNIGPSNICMNCHSGRNNGLSITSDDFTNQVFIAPHYLAAGSILHGKGGYNFPGQPYAYYSSNSHRVIGIGNSSGTGTAGPCIGCHMTASRKHLFKAVSSVTGGLVGKITTNTCANCHGSSFINDPTNINNSQLAYKNSLEVLNQTLIYRNFPYSVDYPYFSNTNWGTGQSGANTMGAAFNYVLLKKEPGGYAHNPGYAKKLIFDSIDYLYNGSITGSIEGALAYLVQNNKISQSIADGVSGYKAAGSCTSCHINSSGSHTSHLNSGFGCAECHSSTAATNTTLVPGTTTHANGVTNLAAGPGRTFSYSGGTCSNISCHSNNSAVWGGTVGCGGCHAIPPRTGAHLVHTDGVGAVYGSDADNSVASTYRFNCGSCHPMSISSHANGVVDLELFNSAATGTKRSNPSNAGRTGSGNSTVCLNVYCHSSGQNAEVRTYTNTPQWGGTFAGNRCAGCHGDPPGYGNGGAGSSSANSHYGTRWTTSGPVESGHLVGLHFDNIRRDPPDEYNPFIAQGGGPSSGAAHGDSETSTTISCNSCHSATVSVASQMSAPGSAFDCMRCHTNPAAGIIADKSRHVNGVRDVVFMTGTFKSKAQIKLTNFTSVIAPLGWTRNNGFKAANSFDSVPFSGSYNSELKSCTTACHLNQPVRWGDESNGCFSCHADL